MAYWIDNADSWICSCCGREVNNPNYYHNGDIECPFCHSQMESNHTHSIDKFVGSPDYKRGYQKALKDINTQMPVLCRDWSPTICPRCLKDFSDYEPCDDGYYTRATNMKRCPYCGQLLNWNNL